MKCPLNRGFRIIFLHLSGIILAEKFFFTKKLFLISDLSYSHKTISLTDEWIDKSDFVIKANGIGLNLGIIF